MDSNTVLIPHIDAALSKGGHHQPEWVLLMLSVADLPSLETRWLRTKFGLQDDTKNELRLPSGVGNASIVWSPVMQFGGSLRNVGALVFIYEGDAQSSRPDKPDTQSLLHEIVRQTSLQSQYKFPVLVINFNKQETNASDVFPDLKSIDRIGGSRARPLWSFAEGDCGICFSSPYDRVACERKSRGLGSFIRASC
jgi:hypothetical protein